MTESMFTTRLSSVITGCGGNETTCSRRSTSGRTRSANGTTIDSPGSSTRWNRPSRSTTPARACGTIRIARITTSRTTTAIASRTITPADMGYLLVGCPRCGPLRSRMTSGDRSLRDQRRGALDLQDIDAHARREHEVVVARPRGPHLAADLHRPVTVVDGPH